MPTVRQARAAWTISLLLFVGVFGVLLATAQNASDQKWVGMASSLPLPGLFALAHLSTANDKGQLRPLRDTVLLGPLLVIPFNCLFDELVSRLPAGALGTAAGVVALLQDLAQGEAFGASFERRALVPFATFVEGLK